jgi:6-phosphogluconolactonase
LVEGKYETSMRPAIPEIQVAAELSALSRKAAEILVDQIAEALHHKAYFSIALSGGSTPKMLYSLLVDDISFKAEIPWHKIHFFWGDERHVPPEHPESNYRMANETMLVKAGVLPKNIHRVRAETPDAGKVAEEYELELQKFFRLAAGQLPVFDCVLQGMGSDGHTASLFPGTTALREQKRLVVANWVKQFNAHRITLTVPVLNNADMVVFLVSGKEKAEVLKRVLEGNQSPYLLPARLIRPKHGRLLWLVDRDAASRLSMTSRLISK